MITEIITTGTELLLGEIDNENSRYLAELMNEHGFTVAFMTTVGDNPERMRAAFATALSRADLVITSGGLGSTQGDITKKSEPRYLGFPMFSFRKRQRVLLRTTKKRDVPICPLFRARRGLLKARSSSGMKPALPVAASFRITGNFWYTFPDLLLR